MSIFIFPACLCIPHPFLFSLTNHLFPSPVAPSQLLYILNVISNCFPFASVSFSLVSFFSRGTPT
ncbi:hypothetical protein H4582DRAFT_1920980 [Lactarius indigo]|nr:hypothetical protein H4582DRAFT_1920980 [Lactarius indigo]